MIMSIPTQFVQMDAITQVEDCRDYLRTGRCKYGASCKYNHPPNVQSGGGMKVPLDPSEPLFPIRPDEPICQYYLKHGTCKFGQACKFHHPVEVAGQLLNNGQVVMNVVRQNEVRPPQIVLNSVVADSNGQGMMLQLLPQRPEEPDCIYFLKNGRCKYGATCRYHHPVSLQQQQFKQEKLRRQQIPNYDQLKGQKVHYVTQVVHSYPTGQIILAENATPVTFINGFNSQGYQIISGNDGVTSYCVPTGTAVLTEPNSSASSLASFETSNEFNSESASAHWNKAKRNGSVGNFNVNINDSRGQGRLFIPHSASESNIPQSRKLRTASYGSVSDHSTYYDSVTASMSRNTSAGSWRSDRSSAYETTQRISAPQYSILPDGKVVDLRLVQSRSRQAAINAQRRVDPIRQRNARPGEHDEGFTMMTSALLNMLDTPEEVSCENYSEDEYLQNHVEYPQNTMSNIVDTPLFNRMSPGKSPPGFDLSLSPPTQLSYDAHVLSSDEVDSFLLQRLSLRQTPPQLQSSNQPGRSSWSPTWRGSLSRHHSSDSPTSLQGIVHPSHTHPGPPGSPHDTNIGLYLP